MAKYIDFDTHVYEPISVWTDYLEPKFRGKGGPEFFEDPDGRMKLRLDDQIYPKMPGHGGFRHIYGPESKMDRSGNDPKVRLAYMDKHNADVQVIFPTLGMAAFSTAVRDPELAVALARAYNRYMGEFTSIDRRRLRGAMLIPVNHPEKAAEEMRRAVKEEGLTIAFMNPTPSGNIPWSHPSRDPFWRTANELGVTIVFHESTVGAPSHAVGISRYEESWPMVYLCTHVIEAMLAMADIILGGTLERFPKLRIGAAEAHVQWLPGWLSLLDQQYGAGTKIWTKDAGEFSLSLKPSDYFRRQCFMAAFTDDSMIADALKVTPQSIVAISDWPHPISAEYSEAGLAGVEKRTDLNADQKRTVLIDNPARFL
jgi:predicted TIM-barrel fold metal-dependent hydrolase